MIPQFNPGIALGGVVGVMAITWLLWWLVSRQHRKDMLPIVPKLLKEAESGIPTEEIKVAKTHYPAIIISPDNVWDFQGEVNEIMGSVFIPDGTLPGAGKGHYMVLDKTLSKDDNYHSYDPRDEKIEASLTPEKLYRAVFRWKEALPYRNPPSFWEKLPALIAYLMLAATFIAILLVLGGKT